MINIETQKYKPKIGWVSCVGTYGPFPRDFGNYFSLDNGPRIINMWAENLDEWVRLNGTKEIECLVFSIPNTKFELALVTDKTIPKEWLSRLCVTGSGWGNRELCEEIHKHLNLPIENRICGCEKQEQPPRISKMMTFVPWSVEYLCQYCGRKWS